MIRQSQGWQFPLVCTLCVLAYLPAITDFFVLDDVNSIFLSRFSGNPSLLIDQGLIRLISERYLNRILYWIGIEVWGGTASGFHILKLALHAINGALIWLLLRSIQSITQTALNSTALIVAVAFFLLHPLQTQTVNYISQSGAQLELIFNLICLLLYIRVRTSIAFNWHVFFQGLLGVLAFFAAILSKPSGMSILLQLALFELTLLPKAKASYSNKYAAAWLIITAGLLVFGLSMDSGAIDTPRISRIDYALSQPYVVIRYLQMIVFPIGLCFDHPSLTWFSYGLGPLFLFILIHIAIWVIGFLIRKPKPITALGIGFIYVSLSTDSSIIPLRDLMVEHRMYLPMTGVTMIVFDLLPAIKRSLVVKSSAVFAILVLLCITVFRNFDWTTKSALWESTLLVNPNSSRALVFFGNEAYQKGQFDVAEEFYHKALISNPTDVAAMNSRALLSIHAGKMDDAMQLLLSASDLQPHDYETNLNLGYWFERSHNFTQAEKYYLQSVKCCPNCAETHLHLGTLLLNTSQLARAKRQLIQATQSEFCPPRGYYNLGYLQLMQRDSSQALANFKLALSMDSNYINALSYMAELEVALEGRDKARPYYKSLLELDRDNKKAMEFFGTNEPQVE
ncbi:MAG: tetratricopeptide repeat protein [Flavobacteriales bacterium]